MKIGIITFHFPYNCGAALQCLALKTKLEQLGHEVCVINYRPWYHQNRYTPLRNPFYCAKMRFNEPAGNFIKRCYHTFDGFIRTIYSWKAYPQVSKKEKKFRAFVKANLNETKCYRSLKQLQSNPPKCDIYISGSDQLWNCGITRDKFDRAYFLKFGDAKIGRITYSIGADFSRHENPQAELKDLIKDLDAISLREEKWLPIVDAALCKRITTHIDLDPTLLLDTEKYEQFMPQMQAETEPYILTYTMTGDVQMTVYEGAKNLSGKLGIRIIDVAGDPNENNKTIADNRLCGPDEFLQYVKNAQYVVTNSYHGTVFAVLFKKKFITIPHALTGNRVTELLDKLGLSDRYCDTADKVAEAITKDIDYDKVYERLNIFRENSTNYLKESIQKNSNI